MSKDDERKKLTEAVKSDNFEDTCEQMGFTVCDSNANESSGKKKCNI